MMTFDRFTPGSVLGSREFDFSEAALAEWTALFPDDAACRPLMPRAMVAMVIMRTFVSVLEDRPPGNVHAGQKFRIDRLPRLDERLTTELSCMSKEFKKDRRWISFGFDTRDAERRPLFFGEMTTIWAA